MVLNLGAQAQYVSRPMRYALQGHVVLSTYLDRADEVVQNIITLRGDEGVIVTFG